MQDRWIRATSTASSSEYQKDKDLRNQVRRKRRHMTYKEDHEARYTPR